jgi:hypothetical protein
MISVWSFAAVRPRQALRVSSLGLDKPSPISEDVSAHLAMGHHKTT